jgi:putative ABC transport system permease protein
MCQQMGISESEAQGYASAMSDEELQQLYAEMAAMQIRARQEAAVRRQMGGIPAAQLAVMLQGAMETYSLEEFALYYDEVTDFSDSSLDVNLHILGHADLDDPASISLYANTFQHKDVIEKFIADYNAQMPQLQKIRYTDVVGLMISAVTTIIDAITYVLIAFVAISLVVSSIMIGVITLISVQERTKEIGILRAIGASKGNVSSMFTAETVLIGLAAGILGVGVTYLACIPINAVVKSLTGLNQLKAHLPGNVAVILVLISVLLTLISGIIPSRSAAKKDPVVALRTE